MLLGDGFHVDPGDLTATGSTIQDAVGAMRTTGLSSSSAEVYGHEALHLTVLDFCSTVQKSVGMFREQADTTGEALSVAANAYLNCDNGAAQQIPSAGFDA